MASRIEVDTKDMASFFDAVDKAAKGGFRKDMELFLEGIGNEFLRVLQDEIVRRKVMDYRLLLNSFSRGGEGNVFEISEGGLTLEVGTSVHYAGYVNDGHWTNPKGVAKRFVPGHWDGDRFIYDPASSEGMVLKQHWVEGAHYWESALRIIDRLFPELLERKLQEWIDQYFGA